MDISTHAPRTGSDCPFAASTGQKSAYFNPRSPHGERPADKRCNQLRKHFNPRSPHGERPVVGGSNCFQNDFNPRSPHGERHVNAFIARAGLISTHAPRTGSDYEYFDALRSSKHFNPRSPHGERHPRPVGRPAPGADFNPRSPHGERQPPRPALAIPTKFQPTLPARGATTDGDAQAPPRKISTHAPRTGSDVI